MTLTTGSVPGRILPLFPPLVGANLLLLSRARQWPQRLPNPHPSMVLSSTSHHPLYLLWHTPDPWLPSSRQPPPVPLSPHSSRYWERSALNILLPPYRPRVTIFSLLIAATPRQRSPRAQTSLLVSSSLMHHGPLIFGNLGSKHSSTFVMRYHTETYSCPTYAQQQ